ncbi:MAG: hypothetical protein ACHQK8_00175 [Bacteroidia bacterium]
MKTNKIIITGIAGGVAFFIFYWLLYGLLAMDYISDHTAHQEVYRKQNETVWWSMILSNFALGFFFTVILSMLAKVPTIAEGMSIGALLGVLMTISTDLMDYSMIDFMGLHAIAADVIVYGVMCSLSCGVIVWVMRQGTKKES